MAKTETLTVIGGGLSRQRTKGAALKDSLYDLLNGYVTSEKTVKVRPGTFRHAVLPFDNYVGTEDLSLTKGLVGFDGTLHVFGWEEAVMPEGVTLHVLAHPDSPDASGTRIPIKRIHFAAPFMGFLYVVAEWDNSTTEGDDVFHYWLQTGDTWEAERIYKLGDIIAPTTPNGFAYQATRIATANPAWSANAERAVGDVVEPTEYNNFAYRVVDVDGSLPRSGTTEPTWPEEDGQQVIEDAEGAAQSAAVAAEQPDPNTAPAPATQARYSGVLGRLIGSQLP